MTPPGTTASTAFEFFVEVSIIDQLVRTLMERRLPRGLSVAGFAVMNHMIRTGQDEASPVSIARALQVTRAAVTGVLQKLVAEGFVTLDPDPRDGRGKLVRITPAGLAARQAAIEAIQPLLEGLVERLPDNTLGQTLPALRLVRADLDRTREA